MKYSMLALVLIFSLGIFSASIFKINFYLVYLLAFICLSFCLWALKQTFSFNLGLAVTFFFLGSLIYINSQILPRNHIMRFVKYKSHNLCALKGVVSSAPEIKNGRLTFVLESKELHTDNLAFVCRGKVLVSVKGLVSTLSYGDELILRGKLYRPYNFGRPRSRSGLSMLGIYCLMRVDSYGLIFLLKHHQGNPLEQIAASSKAGIEKIICRYLSPLAQSILAAMVLGEKTDIPPQVNYLMMRTGTVHILVVSGFNVGIVAFLAMLVLKILRLARKVRIILVTIILLIYCLATGACAPVVRATIMGVVLLWAYFFKRDSQIDCGLGLAAILILAFNPNQLFDIGFQLSFLSVYSLLYLYPLLKKLLRLEYFPHKLGKFFLESFFTSFSAWLGTLVPILCYFRIFSPVTPLANIFIVPLATLITLSGFSLVIVSVVLPFLAPTIACANEFFIHILLLLNTFLAGLPGAYFSL